jgi:hypothetical protein
MSIRKFKIFFQGLYPRTPVNRGKEKGARGRKREGKKKGRDGKEQGRR